MRCGICLPYVFAFLVISCAAQAAEKEMPIVHTDDFEGDLSAWRPTKDDVWKQIEIDRDGKKTKSLRVTGKSEYQPPVRSPHSIFWLKDKFVGDFVLSVKAENTNYQAGNHRDLCLFWGRQDAEPFLLRALWRESGPPLLPSLHCKRSAPNEDYRR